MKGLSWFRVVLDATGKVVDVRPVGGVGSAELGVFYERAASASEATQQAGRSREALLIAARRARYDAEGLCKCGGKRDRPEFKTCSRCSERHKLHEARKAAKRRGEDVAKPDRRTVLQERKQQEGDALRLEVLVEVQRVWAKSRNNHRAFDRWLGQQVERLTGGRKAKVA